MANANARAKRTAGCALVVLAAALPQVTGCSAQDKCVSSPRVLADWDGQHTSMERCGGTAFGGIPTVASAGDNGLAAPDVVLKVGQVLTLSKGKGWSAHNVSRPVSDEPGILRVNSSADGNVIGTFVGAKPGLANVGAHSDVCGNLAQGCLFAQVQVVQ